MLGAVGQMGWLLGEGSQFIAGSLLAHNDLSHWKARG